MGIQQIDVVDAEILERLLQSLRYVLGRAMHGLDARRAPELCGEEYLVPLPSRLEPAPLHVSVYSKVRDTRLTIAR